jgi:hypothetical protein
MYINDNKDDTENDNYNDNDNNHIYILIGIMVRSYPCLWLQNDRQVFVPFEAFEATGTLPKNLVATEWWQRVVEMPKEVLETRPFHGDLW